MCVVGLQPCNTGYTVTKLPLLYLVILCVMHAVGLSFLNSSSLHRHKIATALFGHFVCHVCGRSWLSKTIQSTPSQTCHCFIWSFSGSCVWYVFSPVIPSILHRNTGYIVIQATPSQNCHCFIWSFCGSCVWYVFSPFIPSSLHLNTGYTITKLPLLYLVILCVMCVVGLSFLNPSGLHRHKLATFLFIWSLCVSCVIGLQLSNTIQSTVSQPWLMQLL